MPRAQCYYEILGISETSTSDEIKKAYRSLALVWHPDKNQANPEEAHAKFQTILKAYETLSDSRERDWYDRHKDQILSQDDTPESSLNLFPYFSSSCYSGFDDSDNGFYTIYRKLFDEIAEEEEKAIKQASKHSKGRSSAKSNEHEEFPSFGQSDSDYDSVVRPFYAFWSGFSTRLTFDNLDRYNLLEAENRRIMKAMEKENKKVKDAAKKERNTNIRNLVEFIKKRDKRLLAHRLLVEQQNELNRQKTAEKQRQQRERQLKEKAEYKPNAWEDLDDIEEQLRQLESEYDNDFSGGAGGKKSKRNRGHRSQMVVDDDDDVDETTEDAEHNGDVPQSDAVDTQQTKAATATCNAESDNNEDEEEEEVEEENFFCPACNKDFRSINAFENHEASKKHKQNVQRLTKLLKDEEGKLNK